MAMREREKVLDLRFEALPLCRKTVQSSAISARFGQQIVVGRKPLKRRDRRRTVIDRLSTAYRRQRWKKIGVGVSGGKKE